MADLPAIAADGFPPFVGDDEDAQLRWRACVGLGQMIDLRDALVIARSLYFSDIPTNPAEQQPLLSPDDAEVG